MRFFISSALIIASTSTVFAGPDIIAKVPEISALSGFAALGVIGAVAALVWERRR